MMIRHVRLHLITYGCGNFFDRNRFVPIQNRRHIKPTGGLWASPVGAAYGWREWCIAEEWGDLGSSFETIYEGYTLIVDSLDDLSDFIWQPGGINWPDYEAMLKKNPIDGIYLTERGQDATRWSSPGLYGYDCECVLVMNPDAVSECIIAVS